MPRIELLAAALELASSDPRSTMGKRTKKHRKDPLPVAEEFAARHGISLDTACAILEAFRPPNKGEQTAPTPDWKPTEPLGTAEV